MPGRWMSGKNTPVTSGTWPKTRCRAPLQRHGYRRERKTWTCWSSTARNSTKSRNAAGRRTGGCTCNGTIQFLKISAARLPKGVLWLQNHTLHVVFHRKAEGLLSNKLTSKPSNKSTNQLYHYGTKRSLTCCFVCPASETSVSKYMVHFRKNKEAVWGHRRLLLK